MYHYITCSPMGPLQWMGAVRMRVQTAKNITLIHTRSKMFKDTNLLLRCLTLNGHFWTKYKSISCCPPTSKSSDTFVFWTVFCLLMVLDLCLLLINRLEWCGLLWCFYQLLGFWRHPFTANDPFVSKWCNAQFLQSVPMKKQTHGSWMARGWTFSNLSFLCELFL